MSAKAKNITLNFILKDKTSGSSELLSRLNNYFLSRPINFDKIKIEIHTIKTELKHFTVILNYLKELELVLRKKDETHLKRYLEEFAKNEEKSFGRIFAKIRFSLKGKNKILTLSNSKTLFEVFSRLRKETKDLRITVCESDPGKEGIILADKLDNCGIKTIVIPDSSIRDYIQASDAVIIGADMILKSGNVVNKIGSRNAGIICEYYGVPFYVLASKGKFSNLQKINHLRANKSATDYRNGKNTGALNSLFEEIDKKLITKIITD